jgi:hypothetical protein
VKLTPIISTSSDSGLGVTSAETASESKIDKFAGVSSRFSFPPALDGRWALPIFAFLPVRRSGVAEISRLPALARFCAFLLGALLLGPVFFFSGFSGCGHSTS